MTLRATELDDAAAVAELLAPRSLAAFGSCEGLLAELMEEWERPGFDPARDTIVDARRDGAIEGYAVVHRFGSFAFVAAASEGRGIGTRLLDWCESRQRALGWKEHRTSTPAGGSRAQALLSARGYERVRSSMRMTLALEGARLEPIEPALALRALDAAADGATIHRLDRAAFEQVAGTEEESFAEFAQEHLRARELDPSLSRVAEAAGEIVGFALIQRRAGRAAYVDILAVGPGHRRQGLGRALLASALAAARAAGLDEAQLGVYSDNHAALALYESLGLALRAQLDVYERPLRRDGDAATE